MELEILDSYIVESSGELEEHYKKISEKIQNLKPEYYVVRTDLIRVVWRSEIIVMSSK